MLALKVCQEEFLKFVSLITLGSESTLKIILIPWQIIMSSGFVLHLNLTSKWCFKILKTNLDHSRLVIPRGN